MSTCKTTLMTVKTASGIKRFQDQKELGQWFNRLLQLMKSRASCQPRQAIEPGSTQLQSKDAEHGSMEENSPEPASSSPAEQLERNEAIVPEKQSHENLFERPSARPKKPLFVPIKERKAPKSKDSAQTEEFRDLLTQIKTVLDGENNSVQQILSLFEKENEKARDHELRLRYRCLLGKHHLEKSTCNTQIQPASQTAVSSSPAQAENLYNTPPPDPAGVPYTFRNESLQQTDLMPNTTAVMTESHNVPHTSVTPTRFYNRILGSHSRQNITQAIPPDADMDHYQSQGQPINHLYFKSIKKYRKLYRNMDLAHAPNKNRLKI